jgi:hypothetical protein
MVARLYDVRTYDKTDDGEGLTEQQSVLVTFEELAEFMRLNPETVIFATPLPKGITREQAVQMLFPRQAG